MSTAKERYYSLIEDFEIGVLQEITDYVSELEQELAKLKESQTQKSIIKLCERVDKAEQQVEELKKAIDFYYKIHIGRVQKSMPYEIKPTCPHCKKQMTIKLNIVDKLQARIKYLEKELESNNAAAQTLKNIFGEFKK